MRLSSWKAQISKILGEFLRGESQASTSIALSPDGEIGNAFFCVFLECFELEALLAMLWYSAGA